MNSRRALLEPPMGTQTGRQKIIRNCCLEAPGGTLTANPSSLRYAKNNDPHRRQAPKGKLYRPYTSLQCGHIQYTQRVNSIDHILSPMRTHPIHILRSSTHIPYIFYICMYIYIYICIPHIFYNILYLCLTRAIHIHTYSIHIPYYSIHIQYILFAYSRILHAYALQLHTYSVRIP